MILDFPDPHGSMRYRLARTTPRTPPGRMGALVCSTEVSTTTHAPLGRSDLQDLQKEKKLN